ncbi:3-oxoacyl-[acyl-carrier protein] reductase [Sphingobium faniae]|nr:3-oxoacyl-[acyl-carrier protein] reductase [Sphingobium faniae]
MMRFEGQTVFVTGAARGIGEVLATAFAAEGAHVAIADIDGDAASTAARRIGGRAIGLRCDVAERASVESAMAQTQKQFGGMDILVNNAGLHTRHYNRPVTVVPQDAWERMLKVNVLGLVNCATMAAPLLRQRGGGVILNMSSVSGFDLSTAYGVTKLAVRGLTVALAEELAPQNTRVNAIAPGLIHTDTIVGDMDEGATEAFIEQRQLIRRAGMPTDLTGAALFLCSGEAGFITGETLMVGGGFARRV